MAVNMPTKEQCEGWDSAQLADYLGQNGMADCAATAWMMKMDGRWFLNLTDGDLSRFNPIHRPQVQKMVQDIKKNEDSIFNRLKRFQSEQATLILKTGRSTLDRLKNKAPPQVPSRDYRETNGDGNNCSGSDNESDTYEEPQGEHDDSYEPPPCERVFTPTASLAMPRGQYVDRCPRRPSPNPRPPLKPHRPKAPSPHHRANAQEEDEDYVKPQADTDDDYIEPSENSEFPLVNRRNKPLRPAAAAELGTFTDVYEVPDLDDDCLPRTSPHLQPPPQRIPPIPSPRLHGRKPAPPPKPGPDDGDDDDGGGDEEYEVCDGVESVSMNANTVPLPIPLPREPRRHIPPKPKFSLSPREQEVPVCNRPSPPEPRSASPRRGIHRGRLPSPAAIDNGNQDSEEKAGVLHKPWYSSACGRKMAERALLRANKDGAYLVRRSSGQDVQQPFTLVVLYSGHVYNIPIRFLPPTQRYALGSEKSGEEYFNSVAHIIENHQRNPLVLIDSQSNTKDSTKLLHPVQV
ncbi:B-cell linker protein isoform X2 [Engraulis encrasicolus]|uniref:B-cell linker protein isoform X2 n=1 Tax=Engraulis encrasicolus TaxID=184585 RepID=UPI002FCF16B3